MKLVHCVLVAALPLALGCKQQGGGGGAGGGGGGSASAGGAATAGNARSAGGAGDGTIKTVADWDAQSTNNKAKLLGKHVTLTAQFGGLATVKTEGKTSYYVQAYDNVDDTDKVIRCYIGSTEAEVKAADPDFLPKPNAGAGPLWGKPVVIDGTVVDEDKGSGFSGPYLKPCTAKRKA